MRKSFRKVYDVVKTNDFFPTVKKFCVQVKVLETSQLYHRCATIGLKDSLEHTYSNDNFLIEIDDISKDLKTGEIYDLIVELVFKPIRTAFNFRRIKDCVFKMIENNGISKNELFDIYKITKDDAKRSLEYSKKFNAQQLFSRDLQKLIFAEIIREKKLLEINDDKKRKILCKNRGQTKYAKFWIENRNLSAQEIYTIVMRIRVIKFLLNWTESVSTDYEYNILCNNYNDSADWDLKYNFAH